MPHIKVKSRAGKLSKEAHITQGNRRSHEKPPNPPPPKKTQRKKEEKSPRPEEFIGIYWRIVIRTHAPYVHNSLIYNSQKLERTQMSLNRGMDRENVIHLHNGVLLSY
jgi:hypothetical protein